MRLKLLQLLNKEIASVSQAAFMLSTFALFSQILGLVRDKMLAHFLGPSLNLDIYYAAFRIPDFLFNLVASLVSITVLIPFFAALREKSGTHANEETRLFFNQLFSVFLGLIIIVCFIVYLLMPYLVPHIAPGFTAAAQSRTITVSRIMLLSPIFLGLSGLFQTMTQLFRKFLAYAFSPILYNAGIIFGILFFYPLFGVYGLALGVGLGAFMHFGIQFFVVSRYHFLPGITRDVDWKRLKKVVFLALPRTLTLSLTNLIFLIFVSLASTIHEGSISIFTFAYNLQSVPLSLIGGSFSVAAFPILVAAYARQDYSSYAKGIIDACKQIVFWSLPAIFIFIVLRAQIVRIILGSGKFSWSDTRLTAAALAIFVISIMAQSLILILVRGYYAAGNTKKPLIINLAGAGVTVGLAYTFLYIFHNVSGFAEFISNFLRISDVPGNAILMLPLAFSIGVTLNAVILWASFQRDYLQKASILLNRTFGKSLTASFIIGLVAYGGLHVFSLIFNLETFVGVLAQGFLSGLFGILAGGTFLWYTKSEEFAVVLLALVRRLKRTKGESLQQTRL